MLYYRLFKLANRLFGITIEAADGQTQVWNDDVRFFNIKDAKTGQSCRRMNPCKSHRQKYQPNQHRQPIESPQ